MPMHLCDVIHVPAGSKLELAKRTPLEPFRLNYWGSWLKAGSDRQLVLANTHKDAMDFGFARAAALEEARAWLNMLEKGETYEIT